MPETHQPEPCLSGEKPKPLPVPLTPWTLRARHRRPVVVLVLVLLIVLQLVLGGIILTQVGRLLNLEERIEMLEKRQAPVPE